jgi:hypothetical protein
MKRRTAFTLIELWEVVADHCGFDFNSFTGLRKVD